MGLDIKAYSNLKYVAPLVDRDDQDELGILIYPDQFDQCELTKGFYNITPESRTHEFPMGAYSAYNLFRDILCLAVFGVKSHAIWEDLEKYRGKHFFEIINFTDCDGIIGPKINDKLYTDFKENRDRVIRNLKQEIDFTKETENPLAIEPEFIIDDFTGFTEEYITLIMGRYDDLMTAFEIGRDNGVVIYR